MQAGYMALVFTMCCQFAALVWAAAKLHAAVLSLEKTTTKLGTALDAIVDKVHDHGERLAVLEVKVA